MPNFDSFRLRIILAGLGVIALAVGWYVAFYVVPKASVVIQAQTSRLDTTTTFTVDPGAEGDTIEVALVSGQIQEVSKTVTERFDATGEKDVGQKASGVMTVQNCDSSDSFTLPAGTIFTDNNTGFDFASDTAVDVPGGSFNGGGCSSPGEANVDVTAVQSGDTRNLSPRGYSVSGQSGFITGFGGSMSGGTSEIKTVVSQEDIDQATKVLLAKKDENVRAELSAAFPEGTIVITESFETTNSTPAASQKAGAEVSEASVSAQFTYSIVGVSEESMDAILREAQKDLYDNDQQAVLDSGADNATISLEEKKGETYVLEAQTTGFVGPEINTEQLAEEIKGMGFSETIDFISQKPGVGSVELDLTPFWVFSVPGPDKTTITIEISDDPLQ